MEKRLDFFYNVVLSDENLGACMGVVSYCLQVDCYGTDGNRGGPILDFSSFASSFLEGVSTM